LDGNTYTFNHTTGAITATGGSYSYNSTTHMLTVTDSHSGKLNIDMDTGNYSYQASSTTTKAYSEVLSVTLADNDGDTSTGTLTLDVARALGGTGNDTIVGTSSAEIIIGGQGSDTLTGGLGSDTFRWVLGDAAGTPTDTVKDFNSAVTSSNGDILDLRDLLVGETHSGTDAGNLANYLHFSYSSATGNTTISVTTHDAAGTTQNIVLQGVNLPTALGLAAGATDTQIIQDLLTKGKLIAD
jgi:Ca2+-binding RTX toxin-like protein